jgi:hypothetical protein
MAEDGGRARYDAWWQSGRARLCVTCKQGDSESARTIREQGPSFFPMRVFGPDHAGDPVRYLLVGMEPAEDWYGDYVKKGKAPEDARNFGGASLRSLDSVLQFAAREWLCQSGETFLLTDIAKCPVRHPREELLARREFRWNNCAPILAEEASQFDLTAVIAVGNDVRPALRGRPWMSGRSLFRVLHFAARTADQLRRLASAAEKHIQDDTVRAYLLFVQERRSGLGKQELVQRAPVVPERNKVLLAVYRKQFTCIRRALTRQTYDCGQRAAGTCCKAVSRRGSLS